MMKKSTKRILTGIVVIVVLALIVWGVKYRFNIPAARGDTLLQYIPAETEQKKPLVGVAGVKGVADNYKALKKTNFYNALVKSDFYENITDTSGKESDPVKLNLDGEEVKAETILDIIAQNSVAAAYVASSKDADYNYIMVSQFQDVTGLKEKFFERSADEENIVDTYRGSGIQKFSENSFYTVADGKVFASDSLSLLKRSMDLISAEADFENFNSKYGWIKDKRDSTADAYIFINNEKGTRLMEEIYPDGIDMDTVKTFIGPPNIYQEYNFDGGLEVKSYRYQKEKSESKRSSKSKFIDLMPAEPMLAGVINDFSVEENFEDLKDTELLNLPEEIDMKTLDSYVGDEFGYVLGKVTSSRIEKMLPSGILLIEANKTKGAKSLIKLITESMGIDLENKTYNDVEYQQGGVPILLGQKLAVCIGKIDYQGKDIVVLTSSKDSFEEVVDFTRGDGKSLNKSSIWKEITPFLPAKYYSFKYADINNFTNSIGKNAVRLIGNDTALINLLAVEPLRWLQPAGSATNIEGNIITVRSYFPTRDLDEESWSEIIAATDKYISQ
ncbi:MAG: hypothetical protein ACQEQC_04370 [Elusimicrobiota bacterium]